MKDAKIQAETIAAEERQQATMDNLAKAAENKKQAAKDLKKAMDDSKGAISEAIQTLDPKDRQQAINVQNKAIELLAQLKQGGDVNEIVRQLKELNK